jgi:hypothetical protein
VILDGEGGQHLADHDLLERPANSFDLKDSVVCLGDIGDGQSKHS